MYQRGLRPAFGIVKSFMKKREADMRPRGAWLYSVFLKYVIPEGLIGNLVH